MKDKKVLVVYHSFSGNTRELAKYIKEELSNIFTVDEYEIKYSRMLDSYEEAPDLLDYEYVIFGNFTWGKGEMHRIFKEFIGRYMMEKPKNSYVFGTGDTQFGGHDLFCSASLRLGKFLGTKVKVLRVEQSYRGSQKNRVDKWIEEVRQHIDKN